MAGRVPAMYTTPLCLLSLLLVSQTCLAAVILTTDECVALSSSESVRTVLSLPACTSATVKCTTALCDTALKVEDGHLVALNLSGSGISGPLPAEWSALTSLTYLDVSHNKLSGSLPTEWSALTALTYLDVSDNDLTGELPPEWAALTGLTYLYFDQNAFTGPVPTEYSAFSALEYLGVEDSGLCGEMPEAFLEKSFPLPACDIIPAGITISQAECLALAASQSVADLLILGRCDTQPVLCSAAACQTALVVTDGKITSLNLTSSGLSGPLPAEWSKLTDLTYLDVSNNKFTGPVPKEWAALTALEYLDLSSNQLSGQVPAPWSSLTSLQFLYFDNNTFTGPVPETWTTMESLEYLGVEESGLCGKIPEFFAEKSFPLPACPVPAQKPKTDAPALTSRKDGPIGQVVTETTTTAATVQEPQQKKKEDKVLFGALINGIAAGVLGLIVACAAVYLWRCYRPSSEEAATAAKLGSLEAATQTPAAPATQDRATETQNPVANV